MFSYCRSHQKPARNGQFKVNRLEERAAQLGHVTRAMAADLLTVVLSAVVIGGVLAAILLSWLGGSQPDYSVFYHSGKWRRRVGRTTECKYIVGNACYTDVDICSYAQVLVSKVEVTEIVMREAVTYLSRRHPLLRARHVKRRGIHYFQEMDEFTVPFSVCHDQTWEEAFEGQLLSGYDTDAGPLWRVVFLPNVTLNQDADPAFPFQYGLVFGIHHAIIDATSFMHLLEDLMGFVNRLCTSGRIDQQEAESLPVPLPMECFVPGLHLTWRDRVVTTLCRLGLASFMKYMTASEMASNNVWIEKFGVEILRNPTCEVRTSFIPMIFGPEVMRKLRSKCREHGTKLTGALQVVMGVALGEMLQDGNIREQTTISCWPTVSLGKLVRRWQAATALSCFSLVHMDVRINKNWRQEFWSTSKSCSESLHRDLPAQSLDFLKMLGWQGVFAGVGDRGGGGPGVTGHGRAPSLMNFTNVGDCSFLNPMDSMVRVKLRFSAGAHHRFGPIFFHCMGTIDDVMGWGVLYYPNITPKHVAEELVRRIKVVLHQILE